MAISPRYVGTTTAEAVAYALEILTEEPFLRVFDMDGDGEVAVGSSDESAFIRAVCSAETEVDEILSASHASPFTGEIPDSIREIALQRSLWCAVRFRVMKSDDKAPYLGLYNETTKRLERIAADRLRRIPSSGAPAPVSTVVATADASVEAASSFWGDPNSPTGFGGPGGF